MIKTDGKPTIAWGALPPDPVEIRKPKPFPARVLKDRQQ